MTPRRDTPLETTPRLSPTWETCVIPLGRDLTTGEEVTLHAAKDGARHVLAVGPSGSGKTTNLHREMLAACARDVLLTALTFKSDVKTRNFLELLYGDRLQVMTTEPGRMTCYFDALRHAATLCEGDPTRLAFWIAKACGSFLGGRGYGSAQWSKFAAYGFLAALKRARATGDLLMTWEGLLRAARAAADAEEQLGRYLAAAIVDLEILAATKLLNPGTPALDLNRFFDEAGAIYLCLPAGGDPMVAAGGGSFVLTALFMEQRRRFWAGGRGRLLLMVDECHRLWDAESWLADAEEAREIGVQLRFATHTQEQFKTAKGKNVFDVLFNLCATRMIYSPAHDPSLMEFAQKVGGEVWADVPSRGSSRTVSGFNLGRSESVNVTPHLVPRLSSEEMVRVTGLPGCYLLLRPGHDPALVRGYPLENEHLASYLARPWPDAETPEPPAPRVELPPPVPPPEPMLRRPGPRRRRG